MLLLLIIGYIIKKKKHNFISLLLYFVPWRILPLDKYKNRSLDKHTLISNPIQDLYVKVNTLVVLVNS